jgi:predicted CxxxxCH...CXXCH cytochrome family protein
VNFDLHLDGKVSLGDDSGTCLSCHPSPGGAHQSHTEATHRLSAKINCTECHVVPKTVNDPGHLSASGEAAVFPAGGVGPIAGAYSAQPTWDQAASRCSDVHCHGGGTKLGQDHAASINRQPTWVPGSGALLCGACHGVPPIDTIHDPNWTLTQCAACHPKTIDATGQILAVGGVSTHINGVVDAP